MPPKKAATAAAAAKAASAPKASKVTKPAATATKAKTEPAKVAKTAKPAATKKAKAESDVQEVESKKPKSIVPAAAAAAAPKKTAASKKAPKVDEADKENGKPAEAPKPNSKRKRSGTTAEPGASRTTATVDVNGDDEEARPIKKARKARATTPALPKKPVVKVGTKINSAPTKPLDIFVFGEGTSGELGLGSVKKDGKKPIDVKRPRLNANLAADSAGVVQMDCGGMHAIALTGDNRILTWGVNDQGALGRSTAWDGGLRDMDDEDADSDDDDEDDTGMNPKESTPGEIDMTDVAPEHKFVQVVASDSASFALTEDGRVYSWGTFRASDGILGFSKDTQIQRTPLLLDEPRKITQLAAGSNHVMALDQKGKVYTWGCPEQNQLGRRCVQRDMKESALRPGGITFKRGVSIQKIACGSYHSFAVDQKGRVYAWGLNNYAELGLETGAGDSDAVVLDATLVETLSDYKITHITGGEHHSLACTEDGKLLTWGRIDGHQVGIADDRFNEENTVFDDRGKPRILKLPTVVPDIPPVTFVAAGTDHSFALTKDGKVYSWGFSANYQTGQGTGEDIATPTLVDNTAVRDRKLTFAGAGGQYGILACVAEDVPLTNGVGHA